MDPLLLPGLLLLPNACWLLSPYTAPVWWIAIGPALGLVFLFAAGVWGLGRLSGHGLLFLVESWGGQVVEPPRALRPLFYLLAIAVFPILMTAETVGSFVRWLGGLPERALLHEVRSPLALRIVLGVLLLATAPLWFVFAATGWVAWRLSVDLGGPTVGAWFDPAPPRPGAGRFQTFVALRYLRGRQSSAGVTLVTALAVVGVTLGVWTLVVVLSVMAGFEKDLQDKILGANSHVVVLSYSNRIEDWERITDVVAGMEGVKGVTPFVYSEFMLRSEHTAIGAIFKGIHAPTVAQVTDIADNMVQGPRGRIEDRAYAMAILEGLDDPASLSSGIIEPEDSSAPAIPGIVLGQEMAATLRVTVGDTVHAVSPSAEPGPMGTLQTRVFPFVVVGIFHSGMYEYDTKFSYASLNTASRIMKMDGAVTGLEVVVDDIYDAPAIAGRIGAKLQYPYWTRDWQKMNEPLFAALRLEKYVMGIILLFIVGVAAMNIFSTLIMLVIEKRREIAIMKAMGAGRLDLMKLFMVDGLLVGFIGTTLGLVGGVATCMALDRWQFIKLESDVYYVDTLPVELSLSLTAIVALLAVGIAFLATLFPSWAGSSVDPVEGLRDA
jgi:lipoprotein-releasing system permease protein